VNRRTSATAVSVLLLLAGCGGHKSDDAKPADARPTASTAIPAPRPTTPSATPTTEAPIPGQAAVEAQVRHALTVARAPDMGSLETRRCVVSYLTLDIGEHFPNFRAEVVAALHAAGWKDGPGGGPEETALTNAEGWQAFVDQRDMGKLNGTGSPTRELMVSAGCT
jgi:hypothetical protein